MIFNDLNSKIPKIIHNYEIESEKCRIPCGKVYIGRNKYINQNVYIKTYDKIKFFDSFKEVSLINQEISIMKLLNHKNILQLYEYIESENFIFIIYEYFKGETLQKYLSKKKKLNENISLKIFHELILTMNDIHNMSICHLNLNFENILIDGNNNIKLINFKNSHFYKDKIKKEIIPKNDIFSSPEIYARQYFFPEKADVYSCGIILYYFIFGYFPFHSDKNMVNEELIMKGKYNIPNNVSKNIKNLISKMMEYNMEKRIKFKDIINCEWFKENKNVINKSLINQDINILKQNYPIDENILQICNYYNLDNSEISNDIKNNIYNSNISLYKQIGSYLQSRKIETVNDFRSGKFKKYINNEENYYTEYKQKENLKKYINEEEEKNEKLKEIEGTIYINELKVLEALKQIKSKLVEENYIFPSKESKNNKNNISNLKNIKLNNIYKPTGKNVKLISLKFDNKNKQNNAKRKVSFQRKKNINENNDNLKQLSITGRKRLLTIRMKKSKKNEKFEEDSPNNSYINNYKRGVSFHTKLSEKKKDKLKNDIMNRSDENKRKKINYSNDKSEDNTNIDKEEDYEIPVRKRIYTSFKKIEKKKNNINNNNNNKENSSFRQQRKRVNSTFIKKDKNNYVSKCNYLNDEENNTFPHLQIPILKMKKIFVRKETEIIKNKKNIEIKEKKIIEKENKQNNFDIYSDRENNEKPRHFRKYSENENPKHLRKYSANEKPKSFRKYSDREENEKPRNILKYSDKTNKSENKIDIHIDKENNNINEINNENYSEKKKNKKNENANNLSIKKNQTLYDDFDLNIHIDREKDKISSYSEEPANNKYNNEVNSQKKETVLTICDIEKDFNMTIYSEKEDIKDEKSNNNSKKDNDTSNEIPENNEDINNSKSNRNILKKYENNINEKNIKNINKKENTIGSQKEKIEKEDTKNNEKLNNNNYDCGYLKSIKNPKNKLDEHHQSFGELYESKNEFEDTKTNNHKSNLTVSNNKDKKKGDENSKKKVEFTNNNKNEENNKNINKLNSKYFYLIFNDNQEQTKNNKKNLVLSSNINLNTIIPNEIKDSQTTTSKNSIDFSSEYKNYFTYRNEVKNKVEQYYKDMNDSLEIQKRNSLVSKNIREHKAKIKKFVEKPDYHYLYFKKKPTKLISKNSTNKSNDIFKKYENNYYDYYIDNFSKEISKEKIKKKETIKNDENKKLNLNKIIVKKNKKIKKKENENNNDNDEIPFYFKKNKIIKKSKSKEKNKSKKIRIKNNKKENQKNLNSSVSSNNNRKLKDKKEKSIDENNEKYNYFKNINIIDKLSSKQSSENFKTRKNEQNKTIAFNNKLDNIYGTYNSFSTISLSNNTYTKINDLKNKSNISNKNNQSLKKSKPKNKNVLSISSYTYNNKLKHNKNLRKKCENNLLNLTTKENKDRYITFYDKEKYIFIGNSKLKIKKKSLFNNSFLTNDINKENLNTKKYSTYINTSTNSTKNIATKSNHIKLYSNNLSKNKIKTNSRSKINTNVKKKNLLKSNNVNSSMLNYKKSIKNENINIKKDGNNLKRNLKKNC